MPSGDQGIAQGAGTARAQHRGSDDVTLNQELDAGEFNEADAVDLVLKAGQISLHDVYLLHGSEAEHVAPASARHDDALHADHVGVRPRSRDLAAPTGSASAITRCARSG